MKIRGLTLLAVATVLMLGSTAQADIVPIASGTASDDETITLFAELADGTSFGALLPDTAYTVNITSDRDVAKFGAAEWWQIQEPEGPADGFVLDPAGEVTFTGLPTYGDKSGGADEYEYLYAQPELSSDGKQISGISTYYEQGTSDYWEAGSTILSLELLTASPGTSSLGLLYHTKVFVWDSGSALSPGGPNFDDVSPIGLTVVPVPSAVLLGLLGLGAAALKLQRPVE